MTTLTRRQICLYIGNTDEQKEKRVASLEALAKSLNYPSISAWLIATADAQQAAKEQS